MGRMRYGSDRGYDRGDRGVVRPTRQSLMYDRARFLFAQGSKPCAKCEAVKSLDEFHANSCRWDGRTERCKACVNPGFQTTKQRFEKYVDRYCPVKPGIASGGLGPCWLWSGSRNLTGYGQLHVAERPQLASRISYSLYVGDIGELHVLHKCDNPPCVRPEHLFIGTPKDNSEDKMRKGRHRGGDVHGSAHHGAKLTESDVVAIRYANVLSGVGCRRLGAAFGVAPTTICGILKYRTWRRVA